MTLTEATSIVYMLHTNYPQDRNATDADLAARANLYAAFLADYEFDVVKRAVIHLMQTSKWMPTSNELTDACARFRMLAEIPENKPAVHCLPAKGADVWTDERLEELCRFVGLGYPNDIEGGYEDEAVQGLPPAADKNDEEGWLPYEL